MYYLTEFQTRPESIINASYTNYSSALTTLGV